MHLLITAGNNGPSQWNERGLKGKKLKLSVFLNGLFIGCLLYTSELADERASLYLVVLPISKKKTISTILLAPSLGLYEMLQRDRGRRQK